MQIDWLWFYIEGFEGCRIRRTLASPGRQPGGPCQFEGLPDVFYVIS